MNKLCSFIKSVNNNANIYILYKCDCHAQNNILFILYINITIILTFIKI